MKVATLADMRKSVNFFDTEEVINVINGRKKENIGYFVPKSLKTDFLNFVKNLENTKRLENAKRAAQAQSIDNIGDNCIGDGIE